MHDAEWAFDVTVRNVTTASLCPVAATDSVKALDLAAAAKNDLYAEHCSNMRARFLPLVMSTAGEVHPDFADLVVDRLAFLAAQRGSHGPRRWPLLTAKAFWLARIAAAVVMGTGVRVQERIRVNNSPEAAAVSLHRMGSVWSAHRWYMEV